MVRNRHLAWSLGLTWNIIVGLYAFAFVPPMSLVSPPSLPAVYPYLWIIVSLACFLLCQNSHLLLPSSQTRFLGFFENNWLDFSIVCQINLSPMPLAVYFSVSMGDATRAVNCSISKDIHKATLVRPKMHYLWLPECTGMERWCPAMLQWTVAVLCRELHWQML